MSVTKFNTFQLEEATISYIQDALEKEEITSLKLVTLYIERISKYNHNGPKLNAVIEINPDAVNIAEALDEERRHKGARGPLHGIPVLIKDNINTGDAMHTSAGSLALSESYADQDAYIVTKLREAGAIILGKTNLTEWANFMTENMPNGFSSRGGQVLNPYGPGKFDVSGSSSGSGSAVAGNFAAAAIGTETSGSITSPAAANSLVGIKPTVGLVSRFGIIPISVSQDTAGPMTRTVADAAILLGALTGLDHNDAATAKAAHSGKTDYTVYLREHALNGARIGISYEYSIRELSPSQKDLFDQAIAAMKEKGAEMVFLNSATPLEQEDGGFDVLLYEFKSGVNSYLKRHTRLPSITSLEDVIEYNSKHPGECLKYGQVLLEQSENTSGTLTESSYLNSRLNDLQKTREDGIDKTLKEFQLDAILYPTDAGYGFPAKAGYPSISVPAGYDEEGKPFGILLTAGAFSEPKLIALAYSFEQATKHRVPPKL
ncbi:amidase family protein [Fictibacillus fluitans]|uniref:Amidase family protein n=1 Tax=Fictibacillus fluitans TaxID=3058422 RepID=A0ABT8HR19_9BACL|nr:amidase family protein [Fictibacillus sp. NE201]MDN4523208.1 amidase family protein [Fictibacillus sp. NE201]